MTKPIKRIYKNRIEWHFNGGRHRNDGPAIEWIDGSQAWFVNGLRHRKNGPAIKLAIGYECWYIHGQLHRENGPAVEWSNGAKFWFLDDIQYTEEEWFKEIIARWGKL